MNSKTLNKKIERICDDETYEVEGIETTGKCIPYIGWYWREVDFDRPIHLGIIPGDVVEMGGAKGGFIGFMENNKWGYESFRCSDEEGSEIKRLLEIAVKTSSNSTLQAVSDYMQTLRPKK